MRFRNSILFAAAMAALALAASNTEAAAPRPAAFVNQLSSDLFGYYMPDKTYRAGKFVFRNMTLGGPVQFKSWEKGDRANTVAPVFLEFEDVTSKQGTNELGQTYYKNAPRVLPQSYRVTRTNLSFTGTDKQLGTVSFTGAIDLKALKAAPENPQIVVATGTLSFAGKTFQNVKLTWFGGD